MGKFVFSRVGRQVLDLYITSLGTRLRITRSLSVSVMPLDVISPASLAEPINVPLKTMTGPGPSNVNDRVLQAQALPTMPASRLSPRSSTHSRRPFRPRDGRLKLEPPQLGCPTTYNQSTSHDENNAFTNQDLTKHEKTTSQVAYINR